MKKLILISAYLALSLAVHAEKNISQMVLASGLRGILKSLLQSLNVRILYLEPGLLKQFKPLIYMTGLFSTKKMSDLVNINLNSIITKIRGILRFI